MAPAGDLPLPLQIQITATEERSSMLKSWSVYLLEVNDFGRKFILEKRFDDFNQLHADLKEIEPSMPPLPEKKFMASTDASVVAERKPAFEKILRYLLRSDAVVHEKGQTPFKFLELPTAAVVAFRYLFKTQRISSARQCGKLTDPKLEKERGEMMSDLAGVSANRVRPGMLLVTKRSSESSASSIDNIAIRAFIEAKAAHFRRAVYILTEITPGASDGSDIVLGVNLCRTLETPNMEGLHCDVTGELLQQLQRDGVDVLWMNGGPVKPRHVCAMTLLHHTAVPSKGPSTLIAGDSGRVIYGSLEAVLSLAQEEAEAVRKAVTVLAWAGYAQWSRTQLLGEMARGSWGWSDATTKDVQDAATGAGVALWEELKHHSERLQWAPSNELSRDFEQRFATAPRAENDNQVEVVSALVQQFETMRRDSSAPESASIRPRGGCGQQ